MRIHIKMTGKTPLMMHNERLADPDDPITKQIKEFTDKGKNKTEKDNQHVALLEWRGGLYLDAKDEVCIPSANLIRCFYNAATPTKNGKNIELALSPAELSVPLQIGGDRHVDKLIRKPEYFNQRMVKVGRGRIKRTRPIFPTWALDADFELVDDTMDFATVVSIVELSGVGVGLGDARRIGYGRFHATVSKA